MSDINVLNYLITTDFGAIFNEPLKFRQSIPRLASVVGLQDFLREMGLSKDQYYRRTTNPRLWSVDELKLAAEIFQRYRKKINN